MSSPEPGNIASTLQQDRPWARRLLRLGRYIAGAALVLGLAWWFWDPYAATEQRFDRGRNGLWVGHQWYTGRAVRSDEPVDELEKRRFIQTLREQRIHYVFVHVGPLLPSGGTEDSASEFFERLRERTPGFVYLAWLGGLAERLPVEDPGWRRAVVETVRRLHSEGFAGVHLNIEPLRDHHRGYLELLAGLRAELGDAFTISHATRRAGPFGIAAGPLESFVWSAGFYRSTMQLTDQTVLMAYDTKMNVAKHYVGFVKHQTELLLEWACESGDHQVLIGIPSYEDVPLYSNPEVENIRNASLGVRAALEELGSAVECFEGVAVYAHWVTDDAEWEEYQRHWLEATSSASR